MILNDYKYMKNYNRWIVKPQPNIMDNEASTYINCEKIINGHHLTSGVTTL